MQTKLDIAPIEGSFSLKEHIYEVLKDAITGMNIYDEGADLRLDERQLSEQLRISRTPIRLWYSAQARASAEAASAIVAPSRVKPPIERLRVSVENPPDRSFRCTVPA